MMQELIAHSGKINSQRTCLAGRRPSETFSVQCAGHPTRKRTSDHAKRKSRVRLIQTVDDAVTNTQAATQFSNVADLANWLTGQNGHVQTDNWNSYSGQVQAQLKAAGYHPPHHGGSIFGDAPAPKPGSTGVGGMFGGLAGNGGQGTTPATTPATNPGSTPGRTGRPGFPGDVIGNVMGMMQPPFGDAGAPEASAPSAPGNTPLVTTDRAPSS